jgi:hypothetical protein
MNTSILTPKTPRGQINSWQNHGTAAFAAFKPVSAPRHKINEIALGHSQTAMENTTFKGTA